MIDFLLRFDDGRYKVEMTDMVNNRDKTDRKNSVLETLLTKDAG